VIYRKISTLIIPLFMQCTVLAMFGVIFFHNKLIVLIITLFGFVVPVGNVTQTYNDENGVPIEQKGIINAQAAVCTYLHSLTSITTNTSSS